MGSKKRKNQYQQSDDEKSGKKTNDSVGVQTRRSSRGEPTVTDHSTSQLGHTGNIGSTSLQSQSDLAKNSQIAATIVQSSSEEEQSTLQVGHSNIETVNSLVQSDLPQDFLIAQIPAANGLSRSNVNQDQAQSAEHSQTRIPPLQRNYPVATAATGSSSQLGKNRGEVEENSLTMNQRNQSDMMHVKNGLKRDQLSTGAKIHTVDIFPPGATSITPHAAQTPYLSQVGRFENDLKNHQAAVDRQKNYPDQYQYQFPSRDYRPPVDSVSSIAPIGPHSTEKLYSSQMDRFEHDSRNQQAPVDWENHCMDPYHLSMRDNRQALDSFLPTASSASYATRELYSSRRAPFDYDSRNQHAVVDWRNYYLDQYQRPITGNDQLVNSFPLRASITSHVPQELFSSQRGNFVGGLRNQQIAICCEDNYPDRYRPEVEENLSSVNSYPSRNMNDPSIPKTLCPPHRDYSYRGTADGRSAMKLESNYRMGARTMNLSPINQQTKLRSQTGVLMNHDDPDRENIQLQRSYQARNSNPQHTSKTWSQFAENEQRPISTILTRRFDNHFRDSGFSELSKYGVNSIYMEQGNANSEQISRNSARKDLEKLEVMELVRKYNCSNTIAKKIIRKRRAVEMNINEINSSRPIPVSSVTNSSMSSTSSYSHRRNYKQHLPVGGPGRMNANQSEISALLSSAPTSELRMQGNRGPESNNRSEFKESLVPSDLSSSQLRQILAMVLSSREKEQAHD